MKEIKKHPLPYFRLIDNAIVDNEPWYTVRAYRGTIMEWIRSQPTDQWWEHPNNGRDGVRFDVTGSIFIMISLKWPAR